jgi:hypothetical protein
MTSGGAGICAGGVRAVVLVLGLVTCVVLRCGMVLVVCGVLLMCMWLEMMPPECSPL